MGQSRAAWLCLQVSLDLTQTSGLRQLCGGIPARQAAIIAELVNAAGGNAHATEAKDGFADIDLLNGVPGHDVINRTNRFELRSALDVRRGGPRIAVAKG